jgi:putative SOS response-associated peptidase YedK
MCGRFSLTADLAAIAERFDAQPLIPEWNPRYNIAPGQGVIAVIAVQDKREMSLMTFGFIPHWAKEKPKGYSMINARAETISQKPSYRQSFRSTRCLIPADGFYEWQQTDSGKLPYRITLKNDGLFAFAGIWDSWTDPEGKVRNTLAIITTYGNALTLQLHDRMPVILHKKDEVAWLDPAVQPEKLQPLLMPYPDKEMRMFRVSPRVNSWRNDTPDCLLPIKLH